MLETKPPLKKKCIPCKIISIILLVLIAYGVYKFVVKYMI